MSSEPVNPWTIVSSFWLSVITGLDWWTGPLDWTTGLTFDVKLSHKNGNIVKAEYVLGLAGDEGQSWSVHACTLT